MSAPAAVAAALIVAGLAAAPPGGAAVYEVTFRAEMNERWSYEEHADRDCAPEGRCLRHETGHGSAHVEVRTARPERVDILRGPGGQPLIAGGAAGIPVRVASQRDGVQVVDYEGAWAASNPDVVAGTDDCGERALRRSVSLSWSSRTQIAPVADLADDRDACPSGPPLLEWDRPGPAPSLDAVLARARPAQVGRARQFSLRGAHAWTATVPAVNRTDPADRFVRFGSVEVRWQWRATFRRAGR